MLSKKQSIKNNSEWLKAFDECTQIYSRQEIKELENKTIQLVRDVTKDYTTFSPLAEWTHEHFVSVYKV